MSPSSAIVAQSRPIEATCSPRRLELTSLHVVFGHCDDDPQVSEADPTCSEVCSEGLSNSDQLIAFL